MRSKGVLHVDTEVLVPFFDIDTMHVVWHGHYVKYLGSGVVRCSTTSATTTPGCRKRAMRGR